MGSSILKKSPPKMYTAFFSHFLQFSQLIYTPPSHTHIYLPPDFQNFHVCGKNKTCVGIANDYLNYHVCGFYHTCVDFTKYLRHVKVFGKNHTCVGKYKHVCVFQNTGW